MNPSPGSLVGTPPSESPDKPNHTPPHQRCPFPSEHEDGEDFDEPSRKHSPFFDPREWGSSNKVVQCPFCGSDRIRSLHRARRIGGFLGAVAGMAGGVAAAWSRTPAFLPPQLRLLGMASAAVIGGITGSAAGCSSGASLGDMVDERILANHRCQACSKTFSHGND